MLEGGDPLVYEPEYISVQGGPIRILGNIDWELCDREVAIIRNRKQTVERDNTDNKSETSNRNRET